MAPRLRRGMLGPALVVVGAAAAATAARAADWPMHRFDARRSAASPQELAETLHLQWVRQFPPRQAVFGHDPRVRFDEGYEPVVVGKTLYVGLETSGALAALDTETGEERWRFYADAPVRFAPVARKDRVFFGADDGRLYALDAASGRLLWTFRGAPADRLLLNHGRLSSVWPVSGGPVLVGTSVCFACGVWPIDGVSVHAVDAETGRPLWSEDRWDVVACGPLAAAGDTLLVPSGGLHPARFSARTGAFLGRGGGAYNTYTSDVAATENLYFCGYFAYTAAAGSQRFKCYANAEHNVRVRAPVLEGDRVYGINDGIFKILCLPPADATKPALEELGLYWAVGRPEYAWSQVGEEMAVPPGAPLPAGWYATRLHLKAGPRVYAGGPGAVLAIDLPRDGAKARVSWAASVHGEATGMLAADDRLFVATRSGRLYAFGPRKAEGAPAAPPAPAPAADDGAGRAAEAVLAASGRREGYALVLGTRSGRLAEELLRRSSLRVIAVGSDPAAVDAARRRLDRAGLFDDHRLSVLAADVRTVEFPPYVADLVAFEADEAAAADAAASVFACLRPYGGTACWPGDDARHRALAEAAARGGLRGAAVRREAGFTLLRRDGPLEGAADWTHEHADAANTLLAADTAARLPLGLLWFGGPAADAGRTYDACLPPGALAVKGRYFLQGPDRMTAIDVYTGRLLWEAALPKRQAGATKYGTALPPYPEPEEGRMPEAWCSRNTGLNTVAADDGLYVAAGPTCLRLDPATGRTLAAFDVPLRDARAPVLCWGRLRIQGDTLVATAFDPEDVRASFPAWGNNNEKTKDLLRMTHLFAVDRRTGSLRWRRAAASGYNNRAVLLAADRVFAVDGVTRAMHEVFLAAGRNVQTAPPALVALDLATGRELWNRPLDVLVTKAAYWPQQDMIILPLSEAVYWKDGRYVPGEARPVEGGKRGDARMPGVLVALGGRDGRELWRVAEADYGEPVVVHDPSRTLLTRHGLPFDLLTGRPAPRPSPLTGEAEPWRVPKGGCNFLVASTSLTMWRTAVYDLEHHGGVVPIRGMRSGCTPSVLPAGGVVGLLNYSGGYPSDELRSALVLVHRPGGPNWGTYVRPAGAASAPLARVGLNLGAPGDHVAPDATVWLACQAEGPGRRRSGPGDASPATVVGADLRPFCRHPLRMGAGAGPLPWVACCGVEGPCEITVRLAPPGAGKDAAPSTCTVRLHFAEPGDAGPGERVFSVRVQDAEALKDFDVVREAGGPGRVVVKELRGVRAAGTLKIALVSPDGRRAPIICGVEIVREKPEPEKPRP